MLSPSEIFLLVVMGIVPMVVYAAMLWWVDHWEREPLWLVTLSFLWGAVPAVIFALILQVLAGVFLFGELDANDPESPQMKFIAVVVAPLTEESTKGFMLLVIAVFFRREINSLMDGLVYGAIVGFGFAAVENVGYFITFVSKDPTVLVPIIALRAFAFGPIHAFFTSLTGLAFAFSRLQRNVFLKIIAPPLGLAAAMFFHGLHNLLNTEGSAIGVVGAFFVDWFGLFWIFVLFCISIYIQREWIVRELAGEVALGVLTGEQAEEASSFRHLLLHGLFPFLYWLPHGTAQRRLAKLCALLTFKKRELARLGDEGHNTAAVQRLRAQTWEASQQLLRV